jgi:alginate O-acetyltransferase complex protein AlgJ
MIPRRLVLAAAAAAATIRPARAQLGQRLLVGRDGWLFPIWEDIRKLNEASTQQALETIDQTVQLLRQAGFVVAVTISPTRARIYPDKLPADFQSAQAVTARYARALALLRQGGALTPDFAQLLAGLRQTQTDPVYFRADSHWTAIGAEAAATELAHLITAQKILPPASQPGTRLGDWETRQQGNDLAQSLTEAERAAYPPEKFRAHRILTAKAASKAALLDEDGADIVVVGNSYTVPYLNFTPMLSSQLNRPVSLAWQIGTVSPHRTLLDYLASSMFRSARPKLIVWHHLEASTEHPCDDVGWWGASAMPMPDYLSHLRQSLAV